MLKVKSLNLSRQGKKKIKTRIQKACRTRWLSTNRAIEGVYEDFEALTTILKSFKEDGDTTANGLLKQIGNIKFLGALYLLHDVQACSVTEQGFSGRGDYVSFGCIAPAIEYTFEKLDDIASEMKHLSRLKEDIGENGRLHRCNSIELTTYSEGLITARPTNTFVHICLS